MFDSIARRVLVAAASLSMLAGCSANSGSSGQPLLAPGTAASGSRILPGPAVAGPIVVPLVTHPDNVPRVWPKKKAQVLFVSDAGKGEVELFDPKTANPSPEGSIASGLNVPFGLAVDKKGNLYVANLGNDTIAIYAPGTTTPSTTLSTGLSGPYGIGVDSKGDIFATNINNNTVTGFKAGATSPFETINFNSYGQAVGLAVDGKDNVWVACDTTNAVFEIAAGTSSVTNSGLTGLAGPIGISFGAKDEIFVANFGATDVEYYQYGSTSPAGKITSGISAPTLDGVTKSDSFFQSNQDGSVEGYKKGQTTPFSTITGLSDPTGVASSPEVKK